MARTALVFDAHEFVAGTPTCRCPDAADHAPCSVCGSGKDAFIHDDEAKASGALLTVIQDAEDASVNESHSAGA